ncbi:MAG: class I SAM-dependent methyltransferase [Acidobacteriota bacterium]
MSGSNMDKNALEALALRAEAIARGVPDVAAARVIRITVPFSRLAIALSLRNRDDEKRHLLQQTAWNAIFDVSRGTASEDPTTDTQVWGSSYTNEAIPDVEIDAWARYAVGRILAFRPRKVLEIGCGDGRLLLRIAPHCELYVGTDFSGPALSHVRRQIAAWNPADARRVRLVQCAATELQEVPDAPFDTVVLHSVAQYFPSEQYLRKVLHRVRALLSPTGTIFLGDLRSLPLARLFYTSVEARRAADGTRPEALKERVLLRERTERELLLAPAIARHFLDELDASSAFIELKRGREENELVGFRYDLVLHFGEDGGARERQDATWVDADGVGDVRGESRRLAAASPQAFGLRGIPNRRLTGLAEATRRLFSGAAGTSLEEIRRLATAAEGVHPEDMWALAAELGRAVWIGWSEDPSSFDALFAAAGHAVRDTNAVYGAGSVLPSGACANDPLFNLASERLAQRVRKLLAKESEELARLSSITVWKTLPESDAELIGADPRSFPS